MNKGRKEGGREGGAEEALWEGSAEKGYSQKGPGVLGVPLLQAAPGGPVRRRQAERVTLPNTLLRQDNRLQGMKRKLRTPYRFARIPQLTGLPWSTCVTLKVEYSNSD